MFLHTSKWSGCRQHGCDDTDENAFPGATEVVADGTDQDCDNLEECYIDGDSDGVGGSSTEQHPLSTVVLLDSPQPIPTATIQTVPYLPTKHTTRYRPRYLRRQQLTTDRVFSTPPNGAVTDNTDCDDNDENTFPGAASNDSTTECMTDADGDDYGSTVAPTGGTAGSDCDDADGQSRNFHILHRYRPR